MSELRTIPPLPTPIHGAGAPASAAEPARGAAEAAVLRGKVEGVKDEARGAADAAVLRGKEGSLRSETSGADLKPSVSEDPLTLTPAGSAAVGLTTTAGLVRGSGRAADVVAFEEAVVSYFVEGAEVLGVPKSVAAIYAICFASPEPLSFSEINGRLEISSGSISQGLRVLKEVGALKVAQHSEKLKSRNSETPRTESLESQNLGISASRDEISESQAFSVSAFQGSPRTARYTPDLELRNLVLHWIETRLQSHLKSGQARMQTIMASMPAAPNADALRGRIEHLQSWQNKARALLPMMKGFLQLG